MEAYKIAAVISDLCSSKDEIRARADSTYDCIDFTPLVDERKMDPILKDPYVKCCFGSEANEHDYVQSVSLLAVVPGNESNHQRLLPVSLRHRKRRHHLWQ